MCKIPIYCILFIGIFISIPYTGSSLVYGQEIIPENSTDFYWINGGAGVSSGASSLGGSFTYQWRHKIISVRFVYNEEFQLLKSATPSESVWDLGVLYGISTQKPVGLASIAAGIGVTAGVRRGRKLNSSGGRFGTTSYEKLTFFTFGIPVEGQLFWTPLSHFGMGIYAFANLNVEKSFIGGLFCIEIGKLR